ncbi:MAG: hypothetical protein AAB383_05690 [Patescibacteria group bacterium]
MEIPTDHPAKTYDLPMLSSMLGRCYVEGLSNVDRDAISNFVRTLLDVLVLNKPLVPHADPVLLLKVKQDIARILRVTTDAQLITILGETLVSELRGVLYKILEELEEGNFDQNLLITRTQIEEMFGMRGMYENALEAGVAELQDKGGQFTHPELLPGLELKVSLEETKRLIQFVIENIFEMPAVENVNVSIIENPKNHHLFWTTRDGVINYVTPAKYDLATQFSFDIPHNAAHIAHLSQHANISVGTYIDSMRERAFLESVAVLSEHQFMKKLGSGSEQVRKMFDLLDKERGLEARKLEEWMLADRIFEARLRVARLLGDHFTLQGKNFEETALEVAKIVQLDLETARAEVYKYYSLTGLGGVYVLGPKQLLLSGIENPRDAMLTKDGQLRTSWLEL